MEMSQDDLLPIVKMAKIHLYSKGAVLMGTENLEDVSHIPCSLFPAPFPKHHYHYALSIQPHLNLLYHRVACDKQFLDKCLKGVRKGDDFIGRLWEIYDATTDDQGYTDKIVLAINRSDYLLDQKKGDDTKDVDGEKESLKQVEFNTISCGGASSCSVPGSMHKFLARTYPSLNIDPNQIAVFDAKEIVAKSIVEAWRLYENPQAVIVILANLGDSSITDQVELQNDLLEINPKLRIKRKSFECLHQEAQLREDRVLLVEGEEVGLVYMRWGYSPNHYPTEDYWQTRMILERSKAVMCPNVGHQLAGSKKVQQVLTMPGVLERFLEDKEVVKAVKKCFTGVYSLDLNEEGNENSTKAQKTPDDFVMKPQREGGGNNLYEAELKETLQSLQGKEERGKYILMDKLKPRPFMGYQMRKSTGCHVTRAPMVAEVGIFGSFIGKRDEVVWNKGGGALVRSKMEECNEGGLLSGNAVVDSLLLLD